CFEDVGVADLLDSPHGILALEPIDGRLHRCIRRTSGLGESFLDLSNGNGAPFPEGLHYLQLEFGEFRCRHPRSTMLVCNSTTIMCGSVKGIVRKWGHGPGANRQMVVGGAVFQNALIGIARLRS